MNQLTLVCSTARTRDVCLEMCSTIKTDLDMEIIFIGPVDVFAKRGGPNIPYRFITTPVKPVQCWQIGMHYAKGETVSLVADDCKFSPYAWDKAYALYKEANDYKNIVSMSWFEFFKSHKKWSAEQRTSVWKNFNLSEPPDKNLWKEGTFLSKEFKITLPMPCCVMSHKFFIELGGYDRRFIKRNAERDLFLRAILSGATIKYCDDARVFEGQMYDLNYSAGTRDYPEDANFCKSKWTTENGQLTQTGNDFFEVNDTFLNVSQGPKGDWP